MSPLIIRWHGHSCFEIDSGVQVIVDPHNGRSIGLRPPRLKADIVLVTHDHFDHNAVHVVSGNPKTIKEVGTYNIQGLKIVGITAYHDTEQGAKRGKITMFKIQSEGISILHMGDIGHIPTSKMVDEIGKVDILMLPIGGTYTIGPSEAKKTAEIIRPKVIIPMHYKLPGLSLALQPVDNFTKQYPPDAKLFVGKEIEVTRSELPDSQEIWIFSY